MSTSFAFHTADCTCEGASPPTANPRTFPIFIQFLCNNTKNNNQHNSSKQLTIAGRDTADFSLFLPGAGVFLAKKDPPGVNSKVGGDLKKIKIKSPRDNLIFLCPFRPFFELKGADSRWGGTRRILRHLHHDECYMK